MDRFVLAPVPLSGEPAGNEHRLSVPECLLTRRVIALEFRDDVLTRLRQAIPDLAVAGTRCALRRRPADQEVERLRSVTEWYGFPLDVTVRTDESFHAERHRAAAKRNG